MNNTHTIWSKNFIFIIIANLLIFISYYFLISTLPLYVTDVLKKDQNYIGYIIGIYAIVSVITRLLSGFMLDNIGRKKIVLISLIGYLLCLLGYHFATTFILLFTLRAVQGFFWGFTSTGFGTMAADLTPSNKRGEGLGYYGLSSTIAMAIGPSIALMVIKGGSFSLIFSTASLFVLLGLVCLLLVNYEENISKISTYSKRFSLTNFVEPKVVWLASIMFFIAVVYGGIISFIIIYGKQLGIADAGKFFLIYAIILFGVRPYAGKMFDQKGPVNIMLIGLISIIICFLLLFFANGAILFYCSALLMGFGHGICSPSIIAMAINRVDDDRRGVTNATILSAQDLGVGIGSMVLGTLSNTIGLSNMYLVSAFIIVIPLTIFILKEAPIYKSLRCLH